MKAAWTLIGLVFVVGVALILWAADSCRTQGGTLEVTGYIPVITPITVGSVTFMQTNMVPIQECRRK